MICKENPATLRALIDNYILKECGDTDVRDVTSFFNKNSTPVEINKDKKTICLLQPFSEYVEALRNAAKEALGYELSNKEFNEIFADITYDKYINNMPSDCYAIAAEFVLNNAVEIDYDMSFVRYDTASQITGWNYTTENVIESDYTVVDNYDEMVELWESEILSTLQDTLDGYTFVGEIDKEMLFDDSSDMISDYIINNPYPSEEDLLEENEEEYEPDWDSMPGGHDYYDDF